MAYQINFKLVRSAHDSYPTTLTGPGQVPLTNVSGPVDLSLTEGTSGNRNDFDLTLTCNGVGPRDNTQFGWQYEIFFAHQAKDGTLKEFGLSRGPHFLTLSAPATNGLNMVLDQLQDVGQISPRLFFTFKDA